MPPSALRFSSGNATDRRLLTLLQSLTADTGFVTGEKLAAQLGVSRTAVWKMIRELTAQGYTVEARGRQGYRLVSRPDLLLPLELLRAGCPAALTREVFWHHQTPSTNEVARRLAQDGMPEGTLVITEEQTCGKGRLGRSWLAPAQSSLLFSLLLRPAISMGDSFMLTMLAAVAVAEGIEQTSGLRATIKWPNDVLLATRKTAGILCELDGELDRLRFAVVGIGVNVNFDPADYRPAIPATATSLQVEQGEAVNRLALLHGILDAFSRFYQRLGDLGATEIRHAWRARLATLGHTTEILTPHGPERGLAEDVDADGALLLRRDDGRLLRIVSGDVAFDA